MKYLKNYMCIFLVAAAFLTASTGFASQSMDSFRQAVDGIQTVDWGQGHEMMALIDAAIRDAGRNEAVKLQYEEASVPVLTSDATFVAKQYVCRKLMVIGTSQSIPVLAGLLTDEKLSHMARYALENIDDPQVDAVLIEKLSQTDGAVKAGIINSLGKRGVGLDQITPLVNTSDTVVAKAAIGALGQIGGKEAAGRLLKKLDTADPSMYFSVVDALLETAATAKQAGDSKTASGIYEKLYEDGKQPHVRMGGFVGLIETQPAKRVKLIKQALESDNPDFNLIAGRYLAESGDTDLLDEYAKSLKSLPPAGQIAVLDAVAQIQYKPARKQVVQITKSSDLNVRIAAYNVLGVVGKASEVAMLVQKAAETESAEQQAIQRALVKMPAADVESEMLSILKSAKPDVQIQILECLMLRKAQSACNDVMDLIESDDTAVRKSAYDLIAELGTPEHLPRLLDVLVETTNTRTRQNTEKTAAKICIRYPELSLPILMKQAKAAEGRPYYAILRLLAATKQPGALEVIRAALKAESKDTRTTAIKILSSWTDEQVIEDLLHAAKTDPEASCRILAFRGYLRLVKQMPLPPEALYEKYSQALAAAERDQEKSQALTALSTVATMKSLELIEPYLQQETMRQEVALAVYNVCQLLQNDNPERCKATLGKALEALDGNGPTVEKMTDLLARIDMYQGRLLAEWDFQKDAGSWIAENDMNLSVQDGALKIEPTGGDPFMSSPLNLRGGDLEIQLTVKARKTSTWQIFWGSSTKALAAMPLWIANFQVPPSEQDWQTVTVPLFVDGNLTQLRIDPGSGSEVILIDTIRIMLSEKAAAAKGPMFNPDAQTRVLLIGTPLDHPFGTHMYMHECQMLAKCLKQVDGVDAVVTTGWPTDASLLEDLDAIVLYSSPGAEILLTGDHADTFRKLMKQGVGLASLHWSTGIGDANNKELEQEYLGYLGGLFSFAFSGLDMVQTQVKQLQPDHPICNGWLNFDQLDEIYLRTKLLDASVPLMSVDVKGTEEVVAWAYERPDSNGGRSYGNTLGHFHENFWTVAYRRSLVNGILWAARHDVPAAGAVCLISPEDMVLAQP